MSSTKSPLSSPSTSTSAGSASASSEDWVNNKVMGAIHTARSVIDELEQLVHFHGEENRLKAKAKFVTLKDKVNEIYVECLQCPGDEGEP